MNPEILSLIDFLSEAKAAAYKIGALANQYAEQCHEVEKLYRDANRQVDEIENQIVRLKRLAELNP